MGDPVKTDDRGASGNADLTNVEIESQDFGNAFDLAVDLEDKGDDVKTPETELEDGKAPVVAEEDTTVIPPEPALQAPVKQKDESEDAYKQRYATLQGILDHEKENWKAEKTQLLSQIEEAKKQPTPERKEATIPQVLEDNLTDEDKAALAEYDEEFDVVSKMEGKKRDIALKKLQKEFQSFVGERLNEIKAELTSQITPTTTFIKEAQEKEEIRGEEEHFSAIRERHPDFETYRDNGSLKKWTEKKPSYIRDGIQRICESGDADQIIELLNDFKQENNIPILSEQPGNVVSMDKKKEAKRQALTAVKTRRGAVNPSMNIANDFDGAFDEAVIKQGG
jgi:hypothetical protein